LPLDHKPLVEALRQLVEDSRATGLSTEMEILGAIRPNSPQAGLTFYRAAQEGLTNAHKHGAATHVHLTLDYRSASLIKLTIKDNGKGATNPLDTAHGFGLLGLRERALLLGGEVRIQTSPQGGFTLELEVPA
jgi:signal transduction histidine kinase